MRFIGNSLQADLAISVPYTLEDKSILDSYGIACEAGANCSRFTEDDTAGIRR